MLVLLMGRVSDICHQDYTKWHNTNITSFRMISSGIQVTLKALLQQLESLYYGNTEERDLLGRPLR